MKEHSKRRLQAIETRDRIYKSAIALMKTKGYENFTVSEVCRDAGVAVGSFYSYFVSKNDILVEIFKKADEYFRDIVEENLMKGNGLDEIVLYFRYYGIYVSLTGTDLQKQLFSPKSKMYATKGRYMIELLRRVVSRGQEMGDVTRGMTTDEIVDFLLVTARGVSFDWCIRDGEYDVIARMENYIRKLTVIIKP
ncbi:TetR/AcrR family transcriptional regulator [Youngiibacter multivorans]|uniref:AcrR family transcriptional regulator n=1 Tax=Youngiibacter multivorans TaxID=937251 RepID=A0ABS4G2M6_9CLOT|nr:TetR/AcrR family transcriptional regulator [Youngiibacter multivorans]MBP1918794.1 AcrR family transcriptional regulator [Youngiibacter multivorans]